jgi:hypothetical protein
MAPDTYTRWLCLLEGIELVTKKMDQYGGRLKNKEMDWIKPLAFQKYISERFESMKFDLEEADKSTDLNITNTPCTTYQEPALV